MIELREQTDPADRVVRSVARGVIGGMLGVAAVAVWAVNFEAVMTGNVAGGLPGLFARIFLCEAIPLAILCAIHTGIGKNESLEQTISSLVSRIFYLCGGFVFKRSQESV